MFKVITLAEGIRLSMKTGVMLGKKTRMMAEKIKAGQGVWAAATATIARGWSAASEVGTALKPIARRTAANAKRLSRRGPGTPT